MQSEAIAVKPCLEEAPGGEVDMAKRDHHSATGALKIALLHSEDYIHHTHDVGSQLVRQICMLGHILLI